MPRSRSRNRTHTLGEGRRRSKPRSREPPPGTHQPDVMRGYKATAMNPNASDEARQHAQEQLDRYLDKYESAEGGGQS
ncbi:hypothetical protein IFM47457_02098 [Aspergillus lentulus]|nr:hypothetical protein IFM47457_02098 [Aspergillus lentulus]